MGFLGIYQQFIDDHKKKHGIAIQTGVIISGNGRLHTHRNLSPKKMATKPTPTKKH